ncbi:spermidine synthase [Streptomyces daqingensis]|uniref:Spermidine synthase n=1 Tax=Streptomyces daqingensis TaxID=1472640 RepID=A0ABQ2MDH3_9ACTN|nr:spermidine synthase [Streptomyces daqingensis]GGO49712.1 spermidine synthase [Streptomyces daqingensis]
MHQEAGPPSPLAPLTEPPVVLDRREGPHGEVVLRRHGELLQIISNGTFLMDTSDGRSERLLVEAALEELRGPISPENGATPGRAPVSGPSRQGPREGPRLLVGGLGVGFSLAAAAAEPAWGRITVVEREEAVIDWHREGGPLSPLSAEALRDPRTEIVHAGLAEYLRTDGGPLSGASFDVLCLDIDNGPGWTVTDDNGSLYSPAGLASCRARLAPGGVLAVWSAQPDPTFDDALRNAGFQGIRTHEIPVVRGVPDVVHFAIKPA